MPGEEAIFIKGGVIEQTFDNGAYKIQVDAGQIDAIFRAVEPHFYLIQKRNYLSRKCVITPYH